MLLQQNKLTEVEIAKKIGLTQQSVSLKIIAIKKKLKKHL